VFVYYCSSDGWSGQRNDAVLEAPEGEAPSFRLHFRGHSIVEVVMQALKLGVTSDDGSVTLPSLDDATRVLFTGSSAGSQGMTHNVDWMRAQVPNAQVATVMDAITDPLPEDVDDPTIRDNWVLGLQYRYDNTYLALWQAFLDESCVAAHPGADAHLCSEGGFVRLNHITTPMFVRQDLRDPVMFGYFGSTGATMAQFAAAVRKTMLRVPDIQANAIEKNAIVKAPGVHVSNCGQHIVLMNSPWFGVAAQNNATVETQGGMPVTLHDALGAWIGGANVVAIDTDPSAISVCAATTNDQ
ncbi:MAG: hypothetical protein KC731_12310, partial [Myxococcales bacterium]|nr:hypothetical protein [Myxococcales bacterium]